MIWKLWQSHLLVLIPFSKNCVFNEKGLKLLFENRAAS